MHNRHLHLRVLLVLALNMPALGLTSAPASALMPPSASTTGAAGASAVSALATPSVEPTRVPFARVEENTGRLVYAGPWKQSTGSSYSGGSARTVSARGAIAAMRFTGTAIRWVGPTGPSLGQAEVYVDGRRVATVDQSAARSRSRRVVWTSGTLADGPHRLEIRVLGRRGARGTGSHVAVDAIDVRGSAAAPGPPSGFVRIEERDARATLFGPWEAAADRSASGGSYRRSISNGAGFMIAFKGTAISLTGPVGPSFGMGYVYLDGKYVGGTDQKATRSRQHQLLWSAVDLPDKAHLVEVRPRSATSATLNRLALDAVYVNGTVAWAPRRVEENDRRLGIGGSWRSTASRGMSGNVYRYCSAGGGAMSLKFSGSSVRVLGLKSPTSGEVEMVLDGVSRGVVSLYASTTRVQQILWRVGGLAPGEHELEIRALGSAASGSRGERVGIDGFDVSGTVLSASRPAAFSPVEEDDARLSASGVWKTARNTAMSSGGYTYSTDPQGVLTVAFEGTGLRWIGPRSPGHGMATVYVDGKHLASPSQQASTTTYRQEIWSISGLAPGLHTAEIRVAGETLPYGSHRPVAVDALHVIGGELVEAPRPTGVNRVTAADVRTARVGAWQTRATSIDATPTELRTRDVRSRFEVRFRGTSVTWVGSRGPDFGIAEVILDGKTQGTVDLYDYASNPKRVLWSSPSLANREHRLTIRLSGRRSRASSSFVTGVEALDVRGEVLECGTRFEHSDWRLLYGGRWSSRVATAPSRTVRESQQTSSTLTVRFSGTRMRVMGTTGMESGIASMSVDGSEWAGVDFYSTGPRANRTVFDTGVLRPGEHTLRVFVTGRANESASANKVSLDGFEVSDGTLLPQTKVQKARLKAVDTAIAQLGKRYVWAGAGPTVFDCSGLMLFAYRAAGINLPHYSGSQWRLSVPLRASQLLPGDLCFTDRPTYIHHVGMFIGDGVTINAPGSGRYVEYRPVSTYGCYGRLKTSLWPR